MGDIGEIYVAGRHLCAGYVNNREMERFVPNHIDDAPGTACPLSVVYGVLSFYLHAIGYQIMFRTGDYGRIVNDQLYFEGRADSQIKIRGHRVDLNEVSHAINELDEVSFGGVLCYKAGEPEQVIFIQCHSIIITSIIVYLFRNFARSRKWSLLSCPRRGKVST